ncbi:DsbA family protein [Pseudomonas kurunegalensis]|uniref:DsbA family protein n=1 Tax=Pseudomonas kurunegalensis TaxID=485880 RepID=UPI0025706AA4|nr:protein-disulfide isomerase [Pseudomonas kurunegalensis]WJD60717.1 protein-disulfide isomerase [Pseudomonas kurunegalensis]
MASLKLHYMFDPLCGWCYASADALSRLAERFPNELEMRPTGLFAGPGARLITPEFAHHARTNDQRIASLTGQPFAPAYFEEILGERPVRFDSMPMSRALTFVRGKEKALEPKLYGKLQTARYVEGLDTSSSDVVAAFTAAFLTEEGHAVSVEDLRALITHHEQLTEDTSHRISGSQSLMREVCAGGVPLLLVEIDQVIRPFSGMDLYSDPSRLIETIEQFVQSAP